MIHLCAQLLTLSLPAVAAPPVFEPLPDPNVVVILLDDVGTDFLPMFSSLNPYEGADPEQGETPLYIQAPRLEELASEGVTFLNAYASPRCSPTRASLYTGNYPVRHGVGALMDSVQQGDLREFGDPGYEFQTLAELAQSVGYADVLIGKWHLGMPDPQMDDEYGSDCYLGWSSITQRGKWSEWMCTFRGISSTPIPDPEMYGPPGYYNYYLSEGITDHAQIIADGPRTEYATVLQFDLAADWCNAQSGSFMCVISPNAAHSPWGEPPPEELVYTPGYLNGVVNAFTQHVAMIEALDTKIGDFLDSLSPGVRMHTTFIVLGDNGTPRTCLEHARLDGTDLGGEGSNIDLGPTYDALLDGPQVRFKGSVYEKGTRVPMIVAGAGVNDPGRTTRALVDVVDLFPTIGELIGATVGDVHGISFVPVLEADVPGDRDFTYYEGFRPNGSTADETNFSQREIGCSLVIPEAGRFKIVRDPFEGPDLFFQLEDGSGEPVDPWEQNPLGYGPGDTHFADYVVTSLTLDQVVQSGISTGGTPCGFIERFCPAVPNSTGLSGELDFAGTRSLCVNDLNLTADNLPPQQAGIFFYSDVTIELPFGDGTLCVGGQAVRLEIVTSLSNGKAYYSFNSEAAGFAVGETWSFQYWYRDPQGAGGSGFNFSDAMAMHFCP